MSRKRKQKQEGGRWNIPLLKAGFERFLSENGHYPTALEIDSCPYLCSSRQIQRKFGGLLMLREKLGIGDINYAVGEHRRKIWSEVGGLSLSSERNVSEYLIHRYGEICVHEEKKYGDGRNRVDFYVYAKRNFAVEVFNTYTAHGIIGNLNSKLKKYRDFPHKIFFVVTGGAFTQEEIDKILSRKQSKLGNNMRCCCPDEFKKQCEEVEPLKISFRLL